MKNVAVAVISRSNSQNQTEYLLVKSKRDFGEFSGHYYPPGGHFEAGEDEKQTLKRELTEELGLRIEPVKKLAETESDVEGQITHWWECQIESGELQINHDELADAGYFTVAQMKQLKLWPATKKFFEQILGVSFQ